MPQLIHQAFSFKTTSMDSERSGTKTWTCCTRCVCGCVSVPVCELAFYKLKCPEAIGWPEALIYYISRLFFPSAHRRSPRFEHTNNKNNTTNNYTAISTKQRTTTSQPANGKSAQPAPERDGGERHTEKSIAVWPGALIK